MTVRAEARERDLLVNGPPKPTKEVPTLTEFAPRFVDGHARANQHKPSGILHKETLLRLYLLPQLGAKRLDAITTEDVQRLKQRLSTQAPKSVNNVLTVLNTLLNKAVEWNVIQHLPCTIRLLKTTPGSFDFYDFSEYERLVVAATTIDTMTRVIVLLGGKPAYGRARCGRCCGRTPTSSQGSSALSGTIGGGRSRRPRAGASGTSR